MALNEAYQLVGRLTKVKKSLVLVLGASAIEEVIELLR